MKIPAKFQLHPKVEANLSRYMQEHPTETGHYRRMVREKPEDAVKTIMCRKMVQQDELRKLAGRLQALVKEWISQTPGLHEQIMTKIKNVTPLNTGIAYVDEALRAKTSHVLKLPPTPTSTKLSIT